MVSTIADTRLNRLQSERRLEQTTLVGSSNAYDKQLLSRIGGPSTPDSKRQSVSSVTLVPGMQETAQLAHAESERRNSQLRPLTVPTHERRQNSISDSPANSLSSQRVIGSHLSWILWLLGARACRLEFAAHSQRKSIIIASWKLRQHNVHP